MFLMLYTFRYSIANVRKCHSIWSNYLEKVMISVLALSNITINVLLS